MKRLLISASPLLGMLFAVPGFAEDAAPAAAAVADAAAQAAAAAPVPNKGDTAWLITATMMGHMFARVGEATLAVKWWLYFMMSIGLAGAFVVPALWISYTHQRIRTRLALIDGGFWIFAYLAMGLAFFLLG